MTSGPKFFLLAAKTEAFIPYNVISAKYYFWRHNAAADVTPDPRKIRMFRWAKYSSTVFKVLCFGKDLTRQFIQMYCRHR